MPTSHGDNAKPDPAALLTQAAELVEVLYGQSRAREWGLSRAQFAAGLMRSVRKRFADGQPCSLECFAEYLHTLHVQDLALACACIEGCESAWETFVREYRGYLMHLQERLPRAAEQE